LQRRRTQASMRSDQANRVGNKGRGVRCFFTCKLITRWLAMAAVWVGDGVVKIQSVFHKIYTNRLPTGQKTKTTFLGTVRTGGARGSLLCLSSFNLGSSMSYSSVCFGTGVCLLGLSN
jgi:hypothetical protein